MLKDIIKDLKSQLGTKKCVLDPLVLEQYKTDKSYEKGYLPQCVVYAENKLDIQIVLKLVNIHKCPLTIRAAGSGKSGGAVPEKDGIVLSLEKLNQILEIDKDNACIIVEPGVVTDRINEATEAFNLFYPPNPSSSHWCTIGGNIAENAGSSNAFKYGVTGDYVLGLEGVWANGESFCYGGKLYKDVAGYDLKRLIIGSEGTLAIVTKIILKLIPKPKATQSIWCCFHSFEQAYECLQVIARSHFKPVAAEFLDKQCLEAVEKVNQKKYKFNQGNAFVLFKCDAMTDNACNQLINNIKDHVKTYNQAKYFVGEDDLYWSVRHAISESLEHEFRHKISEDITVPPAQIGPYLNTVKKMAEDSEVTILGYGHLGDGNIHTNILNHSFSDKQWLEEKSKWVKKVIKVALEFGGTLTGEHGVGLTKKEYMPLYFKHHDIKIMKQIKSIVDPNSILNPSKIFN